MATVGDNAGPMAFRLRKCVDPRVDIDDLNSIDNEYIGYVGAQYWNRYSIPATVYSQSEVKFTNIQSPGPNVLWDKKWWIEYLIDVKIDNVPGTEKELSPFISSDPAIMFRPYPLHQTTNTIQLRINNRDIQSYPMESLNTRMEYWPQDKLKLSCGCCPHRKFNGQTLADCNIRKGNAPFADLNEFTDQDYPNSALVNIEKIEVDPVVVHSKCNAEKTAPFKGYMLVDGKQNVFADGYDLTTLKKIDKGEKMAIFKYALHLYHFADFLKKETYAGVCAYGSMKEAKQAYLASNNGKDVSNINIGDNLGTGEAAINTLGSIYKIDMTNTKYTTVKFIDADFISTADLSEWVKAGLLVEGEEYNSETKTTSTKDGTAAVFYSGVNVLKTGSYHLVARIREPVIAEPLDFTSSADFGRTMWNITSVELRYTFSNYLKNMLAINRYKLMDNLTWYWAYEMAKGQAIGESVSNTISDDNITISFAEAPRLIYNIATPFVPPNCPFICAHKQFQRFESHLDVRMDSNNISRLNYLNSNSTDITKITATSEAYPLQFHPNAIYLWVGERSTNRYSSPNRYTHLDTAAKITNVRITYGNTCNILAQFDEHELFQMSLRNGLQDRSFYDWSSGPKSITTLTSYDGYDQYLGLAGAIPKYTVGNNNILTQSTDSSDLILSSRRYAGVGSFIKLIPGIDILTGDTTNPLVAGMHAYSSTIKIQVDFVPLNVHEEIDYSLYVMFEYDGVCTINANTCDLGMIAIDSWAQLKATPKARTIRENYAYGSGLGDKALQLGRKLRTIKKQLGIERAPARGSGINSHPNMAPKMSGGRIIDPKDLNGGTFFTQY